MGRIPRRAARPQEWGEIRCVLWLPSDDTEYVAPEAVGGQQAKEPVASLDSNSSRLPAITEGPSDYIE